MMQDHMGQLKMSEKLFCQLLHLPEGTRIAGYGMIADEDSIEGRTLTIIVRHPDIPASETEDEYLNLPEVYYLVDNDGNSSGWNIWATNGK